jgi:hypothetical protein
MVFAAKKTIVKVNEFGCLHDLTPSAWLILENKKGAGFPAARSLSVTNKGSDLAIDHDFLSQKCQKAAAGRDRPAACPVVAAAI